MLNKDSRRRAVLFVSILWGCFLLRGFFYSSIAPVWEGFDEWAHLAYVQQLLAHGTLPIGESTRISREIEASFRLLPLPWEMHAYPGPGVTHDEYWRLPENERIERSRNVSAIPREWAGEYAQQEILLYEAQQPPLYYWLLALPTWLLSGQPLAERVYLLRYLSVAIASVVIPIAYRVVLRIFRNDGIAFGITAVIVLMPEFLLDISRVANDSLAAALFSVLLLLALKIYDEPARLQWALAYGAALGLGLLTKGYFLTAIPVTALLMAWIFRSQKPRRRRILLNACLIAAVALAIAAWWYVRCRLLTGSWSGLQQDVKLRNLPWQVFLQRVGQVNWRVAFDAFFVSHIYFGNWSFLQLRYWIYHFFRYLALFGVIGYLVFLWRWFRGRPAKPGGMDEKPVLIATGFYLMFAFGLAYHVMVTYADGGGSCTNGWYIYSLVIAELVTATAGTMVLLPEVLRRRFLPFLAVCFAMLDLYAAHFVMIPYYTGLIAHKGGGALATFHIGQYSSQGIGLAVSRLTHNKPGFWSEPLLIISWIAYAGATIVATVVSMAPGDSRRWK